MAQQTHKKIPIPQRRPADLGVTQTVTADQGNQALAEKVGKQPGTESGFLDQAKKDLTPTFEGYEADRYQEHDSRIEALVKQFNEDKAGFVGATADQALGIPDLDPALIKSWLIQETGGGDRRSTAAWDKDPAQVNVPGDWGAPKADEYMGLKKPKRRNEGDLDTNMKAAMVWLTRKGFSRSGKAPSELEGGQSFGGWQQALENYNGRKDKVGGKPYREAYAEKIMARASKPDKHYPIQF
ncbi:MAG: hypothetical protein R3F61_15020 [Myxococcota bacterium]